MASPFAETAGKILDEAVDIQQIPAPTFEEGNRSDHVYRRFKTAGLIRVEQDGMHNVYGRIPGGDAPPVVVTAHLDTVFDSDTDLTVKREDGLIHGPGIGDNSLAVATLTGIKEIVDRLPGPPAGDIILAANVCEEGLGDLAGIKAVFKRLSGENPRAYLVLEGLSVDRLYIRGVGSRRYKIRVNAKGGHSWSDFGETSAVHTLVRLGAKLTELPLPENPKTTLNLGVIQGGRSVNTIADNAHILIDLRSESAKSLERLVNEVKAVIQGFSADGAVISLDPIGSRPAGGIDPDAPLIRLCRQAYRELGLEEPLLKSGSTDANIPFSNGVPAVCLGLTRGKNTHLESEYIETRPFVTGIRVLSSILRGIWDI
ncbi:MAG: M20/M25/M40 family metallo-hydrolase [Desulfobacterales bacterium]|nr:M20/M25/M40 family metallo-hydrolase [Desulfobacterales bacterium]